MTDRDLPDLIDVRHSGALSRLYRLIAQRTSSMAGSATMKYGDMTDPVPADELRIVPANEAPWEDVEAIFGTADDPFRCQCQRLKVTGWLWRDTVLDERIAMHRTSTACGDPTRSTRAASSPTSRTSRRMGGGRTEGGLPETANAASALDRAQEDKDDEGVWSVTCFCIRKGYRGGG